MKELRPTLLVSEHCSREHRDAVHGSKRAPRHGADLRGDGASFCLVAQDRLAPPPFERHVNLAVLMHREEGVSRAEDFDGRENLCRGRLAAACDEAWAPVYASMVPGTMTSAVWEDAVPGAWFDR
jgi:hypothetical protein